jgi:ABC-type branched-subunit amino acid transport system ATPase component
VCSHVYVLDFGKLVFDGPTDEVLRSDLVKAAYLGSEAVEEGVG